MVESIGLDGSIPAEIGLLTSLEYIDLRKWTYVNLYSIEFMAFLTIILVSLFANDRQQPFVWPNSTQDWPIGFSTSTFIRYVDLMRIFYQLSASRF
jgi:hypothetical protein